MCFAEMFAFSAKQSPASLPCFPSLIFLSIALAWSIAFGFSSKKMFRFLDSGVAIFLEKFKTLSRAVSFPDWRSFSFVFSILNNY